MKKRWIIVIAVLAVLTAAVSIAFVSADRRFALLKSPEFSHAPYVMPETRVQIALAPELGADAIISLIEQALPEKRRPSGWLLRRVLPLKAVVLMAPDTDAGVVHITTFVNDQRLGPVIRDAVNNANLAETLPAVRWAGEGMVLDQRGVLTLRGEKPVDSQTLELARANWPEARVDAALPLEGGYAAEVLLDNRDGGAFVILSAFELLLDANNDSNPDFYVGMFANIASLHLVADFVGPSELGLTLRAECQPDAEEDIPGSLQFLLDMMVNQARVGVAAKEAELVGSSRVDGKTVIGTYTLSGLDKLLAADEPQTD